MNKEIEVDIVEHSKPLYNKGLVLVGEWVSGYRR